MKRQKQKQPTIEELEKEYRRLIQIDKEKARDVKKKLDWFYYGIK